MALAEADPHRRLDDDDPYAPAPYPRQAPAGARWGGPRGGRPSAYVEGGGSPAWRPPRGATSAYAPVDRGSLLPPEGLAEGGWAGSSYARPLEESDPDLDPYPLRGPPVREPAARALEEAREALRDATRAAREAEVARRAAVAAARQLGAALPEDAQAAYGTQHVWAPPQGAARRGVHAASGHHAAVGAESAPQQAQAAPTRARPASTRAAAAPHADDGEGGDDVRPLPEDAPVRRRRVAASAAEAPPPATAAPPTSSAPEGRAVSRGAPPRGSMRREDDGEGADGDES